MAEDTALLLPMSIDCFVLNESAYKPPTSKESKLAPISQPNYTFLRFGNDFISHDVLRPTDLHGTGKPESNSRITDVGSGKPHKGRLGVYVHWMIPRPYRAGTASTDGQTGHQKDKGQLPLTPSRDGIPQQSATLADPQFLNVPTRWLVTRHIDLSSVQPKEAVEKKLVQELQAWVVESDHRQSIDDMEDGVDLQIDVSPYIASSSADGSFRDNDDLNIERQAEVFIGSKWDASTWVETKRDRVPLNLAHSSNQLFADYQPHNSNVFSIIDPLTYTEDGVTKRIEAAKVSYSVVGWHSTPEDDIFYINPKQKVSRSARLDALGMSLRDHFKDQNTTWGNFDSSTRVLCHGTKYDVSWSLKAKPVTPADDACAKLMSSPAPISVGTDPLDNIATLVHAFEKNQDTDVVKLINQLLNILALLVARDESVESQRQARSVINQASFSIHEGGKRFYFADTDESPAQPGVPAGSVPGANPSAQRKPGDTELNTIRELNKTQSWLDNGRRLQEGLGWRMFATWWSYIYDRGGTEGVAVVDRRRKDLRERLSKLVEFAKKELDNDDNAKKLVGVQKGIQDPFYRPSDPTVMLASVPAGWPHDYLERLAVRLDTHTVLPDAAAVLSESWRQFADGDLKKVMPPELYAASRRLFEEFDALRPERPAISADKMDTLPLYHDHFLLASGEKDLQRWRDRWNDAQPFFPLFLEWEVEYVHIPFEFWKLVDFTIDASAESRTRYIVDETAFHNANSEQKTQGRRLLDGRTLLLPQPGFSLEAKIRSLFTQTPEPPSDDVQTTLIKQLRQLPLVSSPLTGFTDHLITRLHGTHVKPSNKTAAGEIKPILAAISAAKDAGFESQDVKLIQSESMLPPYSSMVQYDDDKNSVFKPVTHGQFRFTRLNIIDKFGQAIHAIDPTILSSEPMSLFPCTSDYMAPQRLFGQGRTPPPSSDPNAYEYIQIPPQINQFSRLNASFVQLKPIDGSLYWQPTTEWENPVWGWVVINYANYGLQFFLSDGTFYREVRLGGPKGTLASAEWLPFKPSTGDWTKDPKVSQLQKLISELSATATYLQEFVAMIDASMATMIPAPPAYAEHMSSVVGRPLALVNTGWSLELATEPYESTAIGGSNDVPKILVSDGPLKPHHYTFEVQFGSREKAYDGLVGYFAAKTSDQSQGDALDLQHFHTYYQKLEPDGSTTKPLHAKLIDEEPRTRLRPYFFDPLKPKYNEKSLYIQRCMQQHVFGAVVDPFAPIHAFTSLLPNKELKIPTRIWQEAFAKMTTFFSLGPLLLQKDVPARNEVGQVEVGEIVPGLGADIEPKLGVPIPATTLGEWAWLQPYFGPDGSDASKGETSFTRLKLEQVDQRTRYEEGPYTATEGYLQLRKPLGSTHV